MGLIKEGVSGEHTIKKGDLFPDHLFLLITVQPLLHLKDFNDPPHNVPGLFLNITIFSALNQARSKRSRFITLLQAATKSFMNFS